MFSVGLNITIDLNNCKFNTNPCLFFEVDKFSFVNPSNIGFLISFLNRIQEEEVK